MHDPSAAPHGRPKISFTGVSKSYGSPGSRGASTLALADFDLHIAPQEIVTIVGPTGCGKSTSLNILAGFELLRRERLRWMAHLCAAPGRTAASCSSSPPSFPG